MTLISDKQQIVAKQAGSCQSSLQIPPDICLLSEQNSMKLHVLQWPKGLVLPTMAASKCVLLESSRTPHSAKAQKPNTVLTCKKGQIWLTFLRQIETTKNSVKNQRFELQRPSHWHRMHLLLRCFELYCMLMWIPLVLMGIALSNETSTGD